MKTFLTCSAFVAVLGLVARADDRTPVAMGPALADGTSALVMPVDAAGAPGATTPMMMPQLPHYYGRGEGLGCGGGCGMNGGCSSCNGTGFGSCARPRSYSLHLWDDYCYETTRCPSCGCGLGSLCHKCWCERDGHACGGRCGCGSGCGCGSHLPGFPAACCSPSISMPKLTLPTFRLPTFAAPCCARTTCASVGCGERVSDSPAKEPSAAPAKKPTAPVPPPPPAEKLKAPTPVEPAVKEPIKDSPKKADEKAKEKTSRVAPEPSSASLLDRLFPWRTRTSR